MIMTFRSNLAKKGIKTMKIFYKKDFQRVFELKNKIEEEYQVYKEKSEKAITELNIKNSSQLKEITDLGNQIIDMSHIVMNLSDSGWTDEQISKHLGMELDEIIRLKQITGLKEMFADHVFSKSWEEFENKTTEENNKRWKKEPDTDTESDKESEEN